MSAFVNTFNLLLFSLFAICYCYQLAYVAIVCVKDRARTGGVKLGPGKLGPGKLGKPGDDAEDEQNGISATCGGEDGALHRFAYLVSARNEELVIGELVRSVREQDYPEGLVDVYVVADNCTDATAAAAREAGARVYVRNNAQVVGKSHALDFALKRIIASRGGAGGRPEGRTDIDAYIVLDADNVLDPGFTAAMNRGLNRGSKVLTSYRNSKNFDSNWIAAGSALWFLREARFLSNARQMIGSSCAISGTGFMISADILEEQGGWCHHLLTEDIEFSADCISRGIQIGYAPDAVLYDEQPTTMRDSWRQRMRWAKGFYQVLMKYGRRLLRGIAGGGGEIGGRSWGQRFACFDMFMTIAPAMLITVTAVSVNLVFCAAGVLEMAGVAAQVQAIAAGGESAAGGWLQTAIALMTGSVFTGDALQSFQAGNTEVLLSYAEARKTIFTSVATLAACFGGYALIMLFLGAVTTASEWRNIHARPWQKILYMFTFPIYMLTYVPIAVVAVFKRVEWKPISHTVVRSAADVVGRG